MSIYKSSSLAMIPTAYKDGKLYSVRPTDGDGDFTFSRGSNLAATRVASSGYIQKGRENLLLQSNSFNTTWFFNGFPTLTGGQSGYDGSSDAWSLSGTGFQYASVRQTIAISGIVTLSVYAKAGTQNFLAMNTGVSSTSAWFDLANGTLGSRDSNVVDSTIESVGGGWYRCSMCIVGISEFRIYVTDANNNFGTATGNIYIQDAQLEQGLVATDYIETGTSAAQSGILEDMPRLDYSGGASCPSLKLEPQRSNVVTQSEYLGSYTPERATITDNAATSPEGMLNAASFIETAVSGRHRTQTNSFAVTSGSTYTFSMFVKNKSGNRLLCINADYLFNARSYFDIVDGAVEGTDSGSASIEDYGNGWYRCSVTGTSSITGSSILYIGLEDTAADNGYTGDGTSGHYWYGLQAEAGSYPTSYIPTYGSSVTRGKDVCDGAGDADLYNDSQGVLFTEVSFARDKGKSSPFKVDRISLSDGTSNNRILISNTTTANQIQAFIRNSSGTIFNETITLTDITANNKIAVRYESGNYALYINGTEEATGTSSNVPSGLNELMFDGPSGNYEFEGKVKQAIYFPTALTNTELASLTTL